MKLSKLYVTIGLGALVLGGASVLAFSSSRKSNRQPAVASSADGYTTYYSGDLGFATRNSSDTRIVLGDVDGGMQTKGNVLNAKSELIFNFKKTLSNYWIGVGGYAIYVSSDTTVRFLYLSYNSNGPYVRNAELSNLVMKTADGATALTSVTADGKLFSDYTTAVLRFDLSNPSSAKAHFHVVYNDVEYYPFNGSTLIDTVTYTHTASGFDSSDTNRAMAGANAQDSGVQLMKFQTYDDIKNLYNVFTSAQAPVFGYGTIGDFYFNFNLSEQIFKNLGYFNDHLTDGTYKDYNGQIINLADGIVINEKTLGYWVSYTDSGMTFPDNSKVHSFPLSVGGQFSPVAIQIQANSIDFKVNADYIPMDSIVITFKAGVFQGFNADVGAHGTTYQLSEDVTFYSTLEATDASAINNPSTSVKFVRATNETVKTNYKITDLADDGVHTNSHDYEYYKYTIWTNIPRNTNVNNWWTQDHYRYLYNNIMLNGKEVAWYNSWARGNSKDATDAYETQHAVGSANPMYDLAVQLQIATDQPNYVMFITIPVQLMTDLGLATPEIALRDSSAWLTTTGVIRLNCTPLDRVAVEDYVAEYMHMSDYTTEQGYCKDNEHHYYLTAKTGYNALTSEQKTAFQIASCFKAAKDRYEAWATANGDANPYDGNNSISSSSKISQIAGMIDYSVIITLAIAMMILLTFTAFILLKRKNKTC